MANDENGEKTEQPSEHRRSEARQKGNVARSIDLNTAGMMLAAAFVIWIFLLPTARSLGELMQTYLRGPLLLSIDRAGAVVQFWTLGKFVATIILPPMMLMMATALFLNLVQVGFLASPEALQPQLSRLNPLEGVKRIFSMQAVMKLVISLCKIAIIAAIAGWTISGFLPRFFSMADSEPGVFFSQTKSAIVTLAFLIALALIVLAIVDVIFQRWKHEQGLKMSKQEVREEMKNMDGDPLIRTRRREAHRKLVQAREMQQVQHADVVITNPTHLSIALKYDPEIMPAPAVVAKGRGELALRIRQIAAEQGIPIIERKPLAQALYRDVKVGEAIPIDMYEVFVEIMAYVYRLSGQTPAELG